MRKEFEHHEIDNEKCSECDEWSFMNGKTGKKGFYEYIEVQFPIKHENCGGYIHLYERAFSDGYSTDISLDFQCDKCEEYFNTWTEGEFIDDEFVETFGFHPIIKKYKKGD